MLVNKENQIRMKIFIYLMVVKHKISSLYFCTESLKHGNRCGTCIYDTPTVRVIFAQLFPFICFPLKQSMTNTNIQQVYTLLTLASL